MSAPFPHRERLTLRQVVHCRECAQPMNSIYDPTIRHTCSECGGVSLSQSFEESRQQILDRYEAQARALKAQRIAERAEARAGA